MILFLDFETYYADDYTLRDMTPAEYILDPRFEMILCAVKENNDKPYIVEGPDFSKWVEQHDRKHGWANTTTVTHNALFDNCILAWRYGVIPARILCTMRLASALRGHELQSASLSAVAESFGLGEKGTAIHQVKNMRLQGIRNGGLMGAFIKYSLRDVELCADIFNRLIPEFPRSERRVMDLVLRCAVEPAFAVDKELLRAHLADLEQQRRELLDSVNLTPQELRSSRKFVEILMARRINVEYKTSPSDPDKRIPALAKTDKFMEDLLNHDDPEIQALAAARLGMRSTIEQKRAERILAVASCAWPSYCRGNMPIPLRYSGAHTHRLSGDWKINMQNLPSGRGGKVSKLRTSLRAPEGYKVITADLAQIEARICAWVAGEQALVQAFREQRDVYCEFGGKLFGYPINKRDHPIERFIAKTAVLGLGFGCGSNKFYNMVLQFGRTVGIALENKENNWMWSLRMAEHAVQTYRTANWYIWNSWNRLEDHLRYTWGNPNSTPTKYGPCEIGYGYVRGPNDLIMRYKVKYKPFQQALLNRFAYSYGKQEHTIYGAKFLENIVQFLARIVVMNTALRLHDRGFTFKLQAHDELVFIVPNRDIERAKQVIHEEMTRPPSWAKDLPLEAEIGVGGSYGEAK